MYGQFRIELLALAWRFSAVRAPKRKHLAIRAKQLATYPHIRMPRVHPRVFWQAHDIAFVMKL